MANILFYSPFNHRSRDTESLMIAFKKQGHKVISLSQSEGFFIHQYLKTQLIETYTYMVSSKPGISYYIKHIFYFISFCKKHEVDIVYSHLEPANFVAVIARFFIKARVFIVRHHINEAALKGFDQSLFYKITYQLSGKTLVVSEQAKRYMIAIEKINAEKIVHVNLAYDFGLYNKPDAKRVESIKNDMSTDLILITVCRFTEYKRAKQSVLTLKKLLDSGIDSKLILLGEGEEKQNLIDLSTDLGILDRVIMPGYVENVIDYLAAAHFLLHPSISESSCVVVKEAAIASLPVIVCKAVGDFDDYISNGVEGFVVDQNNFVDEAFKIINSYRSDKKLLDKMSVNLGRKIHQLFDIGNVIGKYESLNKK